ncbi:MAG: mycothiol system anti-sigma-R factor [Thermoanaerobaculia bacterium]
MATPGRGMDCERVREVIFLYADNELEEEVCLAIREHLVICPHCARRIAYTTKVLTIVRKRCTRALAPESLRQRILTGLPHRGGGGR